MSNNNLQWVCFEVFRCSNSIFQSPHYFRADRLIIWQLSFSVNENMRLISFNRRYVDRPESNQRFLDPQSDSLSMLGTQLQCIHEPPHDKTNKMAIAPSEDTDQPVHPPSLITESSLSAWRNIGSSATNWVHCEDSDQTERMPRLIWVFVGHKSHLVGFVMRWLTFRKCILIFASGLRNKPHFWKPCSLALWLQRQGLLVRAPVLAHTGYKCNVRYISHEIMYMFFLLFPLIQEKQFLVISESICTLDHFVLVNCLEELSLSARRSWFSRSFNCIPGIYRPRISQSDLLVHARDSRSPKPILA